MDSFDHRVLLCRIMNILHRFLDVLICLSHSCTEISCDSLLLCHLLNHLINLIRCSIHVIFPITAMTMNVNKSRNNHCSCTTYLKIPFFRLEPRHITDFFNLLIKADIAIFDYTVPSINLLLLDQFHVVLPRFLLFRILVSVKILNRYGYITVRSYLRAAIELLLFYYLTIQGKIPSIFHNL